MRLKRYEIHIYDDVCVDLFNNGVLDKSINNTYKLEDLLNQQDKRIKELQQQLAESEKSNEYFADRVEKADKEIKEIYKEYNKLVEEYNNLKEEVDNNFVDGQKYNELKQQLHDLPKKIAEEIRDIAGDYWDFNICEECGNVPDLNTLTMEDFDEILDTILEKFGGEDE